MVSVRWMICVAPIFLASVTLGSSCASAQVFFGGQQQQDWVSNWAFNGRTEKQVESQLKSDYQMRLKMIDRLCDLQQPQVAKMTTAGDADVSRFFRDVAKARREVDALGLKGNNNNDINQMWQIVSPISQQMQAGIFSDKSLFQKVMRSTLSEGQHGLYEAELKKNRQRRWQTITRVNVAEIEKSTPLLADQRQKLLELLDAQEIPDKINSNMDAYIGFLKLLKAKKQDKKLGNILDKQQMVVIQKYCDRYRGWGNMIK